jgi:hypothetical protein
MTAKTRKPLTPEVLREARRASLHLDGMLRLARGIDLLARGGDLPNNPRDLDKPWVIRKSCT